MTPRISLGGYGAGFLAPADFGYWINILVFNPAQDICFLGEVSPTTRTMHIGVGRNLCDTAYPVEVPLDDSGLVASGFTGSSSKFFSDNLEWWDNSDPDINSHNYVRAWYDTSSSSSQGWDGDPLRSLNPCEGFWVNVLSFNTPFTWTYPKSYSQPPNN